MKSQFSRNVFVVQWRGTIIASFAAIVIVYCIVSINSNWRPRPIDLSYLEDVHVSEAASVLPTNGTLFCWVMTSPKYHDSRVLAVNDTWIHRCDHGQFFTSKEMLNESIPYTTVFSELPDKYEDLFPKTRVAFYYIWKFISRRFDWYMKADDDTYVIVENLREYLKRYDPMQPYFIGFRMKPYVKHGYNAGGSGYLLSRGALEIYSSWVRTMGEVCERNQYEDVGMGKCLSRMGIFPIDSRDESGRQRFNTFEIHEIFFGEIADHWYMDPVRKGFEAFSPETISFHHLSPEEMRLVEVLLYRVRLPNSSQSKISP